jgi:NAD(P)-dependent dehydrogenase (short-subunit alcohol dehydrogenase family)
VIVRLQGIGAEIAKSFARAGAARIALLGRRQQPLLDTKEAIERLHTNTEVFAITTDVTDQVQVDAAFVKTAGDGKIDVLVSNAAVIGNIGLVTDSDPAIVVTDVQQSIKTTLFLALALIRHASAKPVVVNISSAAAHMNLRPGTASYNTSKMASFRLWDSIAYENPHLDVFHVQPGVIDTAMSRQVGGVKSYGYEDDGELRSEAIEDRG